MNKKNYFSILTVVLFSICAYFYTLGELYSCMDVTGVSDIKKENLLNITELLEKLNLNETIVSTKNLAVTIEAKKFVLIHTTDRYKMFMGTLTFTDVFLDLCANAIDHNFTVRAKIMKELKLAFQHPLYFTYNAQTNNILISILTHSKYIDSSIIAGSVLKISEIDYKLKDLEQFVSNYVFAVSLADFNFYLKKNYCSFKTISSLETITQGLNTPCKTFNTTILDENFTVKGRLQMIGEYKIFVDNFYMKNYNPSVKYYGVKIDYFTLFNEKTQEADGIKKQSINPDYLLCKFNTINFTFSTEIVKAATTALVEYGKRL